MKKIEIQNLAGGKSIVVSKEITAVELLDFSKKIETNLANLTEYLPRVKVSVSDEMIYFEIEICSREFDMLGVVQYFGESVTDSNFFKMYLVNSGPMCRKVKIEKWHQIMEEIDDFTQEIILGGIPFA